MVHLAYNADIKKEQMIMTLRGCALYWFMNFCAASTETLQKTLNEIQAAMISKFKKTKFESQCITEIKEIKQALVDSVWDFNQ